MASSLAKRLTYRITAVVLVMMAVIAGFTYFTVKKYMLQEAQERYEGVLLRDHEESRRRLLECVHLATSHTGGYWHESGGISPDAHPRFLSHLIPTIRQELHNPYPITGACDVTPKSWTIN